MRNLVYYPTFEPSNLTWLKYAILYVDEFSPIIPERGRSAVSDIFRRISDNTNLINMHVPQYWQGDNASTKALNEIELILSYPSQYRDKLKSVSAIRAWRNPDNWTHRLYQEKFNNGFKYQCIDMGLGAEHDGDLMTSASLAHLYMTFLAEEVAYEGGGNPVTDNKDLDNLSTYLRTRNPRYESLVQAIETVINISLPTRIENISIDRIIQFRNDTGITEMRQDFNHSLERFYSSIEEGLEPESFIRNLQKTNVELAKEVALCFAGSSAVALGGIIMCSNPSVLETIKLSIEGTSLAIGSTLGINKAWADGREKRNSRKFINKLKSINKFQRSIY